MENQAFYDSLIKKVKDNLNYKERQELKSLKQENIPVIEKKILKLKKQLRFAQIMMIICLIMIILFSVANQWSTTPRLHYFFVTFPWYITIYLGVGILGKGSLSHMQKRIDTFELLLILTENESNLKISTIE